MFVLNKHTSVATKDDDEIFVEEQEGDNKGGEQPILTQEGIWELTVTKVVKGMKKVVQIR